ncbi:MAG: 4'-phosphopantetheinyl transferase superfamily protein [Clostridia bacterium]|nr:4'-phosphopantetheinyl transferase superfamily protein [Clostridia bacterium]
MVEIQIVKLSNDIPFSFSLLSHVQFDKRLRIMGCRSSEEKKRSLVGELLIRKAVKDKLNIPFHKIRISHNQYGKPYIDNVNYFKFNISHSGCYVVIATSTHKVGVDIEKIQPVDLGVASRFYTEKEYKYIQSLPCDDKKVSEFFRLWTLKESYIKAIGKGMKIPLNSFEFDLESGKSFIKENRNKKYLFYTRSLDDYFLSVCFMEKDINYDFKALTEEELYGNFS